MDAALPYDFAFTSIAWLINRWKSLLGASVASLFPKDEHVATHSPMRPHVNRSVLMLNILVVLVFGGQNLSSYHSNDLGSATTTTLVLCAGCFILVPVLGLETWMYQNKQGETWHDRYGNTPVSGVCLAILYACMWAFVPHVVTLLASWKCDICDGNPAAAHSFFHVAYWLHVIPSGVIAVAGPLQFTPAVRKLCRYAVHRWLGRFILVASVVHQASATALFVSEEWYSKVGCSAGEADCGGWTYRIYVAGFIPKNLLSWTAIVLGFAAARQKRFAEHGAWMYRLGAMWIITVIVAHIIIYPVGWLVGPEWKYAAGEWIEWLFVIPAEIYIRKSGRFNLNAEAESRIKVDSAHNLKNGLECPFLVHNV